jgi:hypothetical protein
MSETAGEPQSKPVATPGGSGDQRVLAEVEKWMAIIREISGEPQGQTIVHADQPPATG